QCHNRDMKTVLTGPPLGPAEANWSQYPREDLINWIRNSQAMIAEGHPRAVTLWEEFKPTVMNSFPNLTDQEIESILAYVNQQYTAAPVAAAPGAPGVQTPQDTGSDALLYIILLVLLAALAFVLARVISNLNQIAQVQEGKVPSEPRSILQMLTNRTV